MASVKTASEQHNGANAVSKADKSTLFHHASPGEQPPNDAGYLEFLSFAMFSSAIGNHKAISEVWPDILYSFKSFHVQRVSEFSDQDVQEVHERVPILRDKAQVSAVVTNAVSMMRIAQVYGSFKKYLRTFEEDGPGELLKDLADRFPQVERNVFQEFLKYAATGIKLPEPPKANRGGKSGRSGRSQRRNSRPPNGSSQRGRPRSKSRRSSGSGGGPNAGNQKQGGAKGSGQGKSRRSRRQRFGGRKKKEKSSSGS